MGSFANIGVSNGTNYSVSRNNLYYNRALNILKIANDSSDKNKDIQFEERPWGYFQILTELDDHKVKRITLKPGKRISLQRHKNRSEHWFFLQGSGIVTLNDKKINVKKGLSIDIQKEELHRVENTGNSELVFIEIQLGDYFGEDDIERLEDDFGRLF